MKIPDNILVLIDKYQAGTANAAEKKLLDEWYHSFNDQEIEVDSDLTEEQVNETIKARLLATIQAPAETPVKKVSYRWHLVAAAAIILIVLSIGRYLLLSSNPPLQDDAIIASNPAPQPDIAPGTNKAVLVLGDGSTIVLDSAQKGSISKQGITDVQKMANGLIAYNTDGKQPGGIKETIYNTISTPRGGQYQVTLSDGTRVWLNAASSIRFPVAFNGNERSVVITGEAYFEVAKNKEKPFLVKTNLGEIEVLGTHFNVNAYDDEAIAKTTLLEGSVKITVPRAKGGQPAQYLVPGQQAGINKKGNISILNNADTEEAIAWMKGHFQFNSADLRTIFRQISRWYDVDVEYKGNVNLHFTGQLTRTEYVSKVFEKLALTGEVHFKIDGRKIIVSP